MSLNDVNDAVMINDFTQELMKYTIEESLMFSGFKKTFNKSYQSAAVEKQSWLNFLSNQRAILLHNMNYAAGLVSFSVSLYSYSDMTPEDVSRRLNGFRLPVSPRSLKDEDSDFVLPKTLNWVTKGFVSKGSLRRF